MSAEQKDLEQNALAARLNRAWTNFRQGKLIGYKWLALLLILVAGIGTWWYISSERKALASQRWAKLQEASSLSDLEEFIKNNPNTVPARLARLQAARVQLGPDGIDLLAAPTPDGRKRGAENIEKAREEFGKLLGEFKNDPVFKAECLLALAKAEAALVVVPVKPGSLTEFKGQVGKVVEYLDQLAAAAAPDTPWATESKRLADALRNPESAVSKEFLNVQRQLFTLDAAGGS